jgi:hypothetical protein
MTSIAIMQPYFFPYLGYFRLLAAVDIFVHFDCVQFPRRGYVHRNQMPKYAPTAAQQPKYWLTLPLAGQAQDIRIADLVFAPEADREWQKRLSSFPWISKARDPDQADLIELVRSVANDAKVSDYLIKTLEFSADRLGLKPRMLRSSTLRVADHLRGQDRILEILRMLGGTRYVNAPGGRGLYDAAEFERNGIELEFLPPFQGRTNSILYEFCFHPVEALRAQLPAMV